MSELASFGRERLNVAVETPEVTEHAVSERFCAAPRLGAQLAYERAQFPGEIVERARRRQLHVESGHGERSHTTVAGLSIGEQGLAFSTRRPYLEDAALRGFDRIEIAAKACLGAFEVDEARFPNQHVEPEPLVQQPDQANLGGECRPCPVARFAKHHNPGVSDRCNQPLRVASNPISVGTAINRDRALLDPAL